MFFILEFRPKKRRWVFRVERLRGRLFGIPVLFYKQLKFTEAEFEEFRTFLRENDL